MMMMMMIIIIVIDAYISVSGLLCGYIIYHRAPNGVLSVMVRVILCRITCVSLLALSIDLFFFTFTRRQYILPIAQQHAGTQYGHGELIIESKRKMKWEWHRNVDGENIVRDQVTVCNTYLGLDADCDNTHTKKE